MFRRRFAIASAVAAVAGTAVVPTTAVAEVLDEATIDREVHFRTSVALPHRRQHVLDVNSQLDAVDLYGMRFTPDEAAELTARERTAAEVTQALRSLRSQLPAATFAGEYVDHPAGRVVVRVTAHQAEVSQGLADAVSDDSRVTVVPATHSQAALAAVVDQLANASAGARLVAGVDIAVLRPDVVENDVDVLVRGNAAEAAAALAAAYPRAPLDVSTGSAKPTVNEKLNVLDAPPLKGGQDIRFGTGRCTSAFVTYNLVRLDAAIFTYEFFLLTAGHCGGGQTATAFTQVGYPIGTSAANGYYGTGVDGNAIRMSTADRSNQVFERRSAGGVHYYRSIRSVESEGATTDMVGQAVCHDGVTNNYLCGTIAAKGVVANYEADPALGLQATQIRDLREGTQRSDGGDSGASVHSGELAKGVLSGSVTYSTGDVNFIYSHVRDVLRVTGVTYVKTSFNSDLP